MLVERLDAFLGDPSADGTFSARRCAELDQAGEFPADTVQLLDDWGLHHYYVPARFGGQLDDFVTALQLIRAVARRDLTVAIAHGKIFLGGVSAWVAQDDAAALALAGKVLGGHPVSWGLTERDHGSDLLSGEVTADAVTGGYRISGEKWLISNATRGRVVSVLARSPRRRRSGSGWPTTNSTRLLRTGGTVRGRTPYSPGRCPRLPLWTSTTPCSPSSPVSSMTAGRWAWPARTGSLRG